MASPSNQIPERALYRPAEVCEIASVQPYVLRTWEAEFPALGVAQTPGGARLYRREDLERVLQIKQLLFGEGLTLAGVRRRLDENGQTAGPLPSLDGLIDQDVRARLVQVRTGLRLLLELLSRERGTALGPSPQRTAEPRQPAPTQASRPRRPVKPSQKTRHASA